MYLRTHSRKHAHIYVCTACLVDYLSNFFEVISYVFKYTESQQLSYLAYNLLSEVICGPHVKKFGDPWSRLT
jgi:hypothetical protein